MHGSAANKARFPGTSFDDNDSTGREPDSDHVRQVVSAKDDLLASLAEQVKRGGTEPRADRGRRIGSFARHDRRRYRRRRPGPAWRTTSPVAIRWRGMDGTSKHDSSFA